MNIGTSILYLEKTESTMDDWRDLGLAGKKEGTIVTTDYQGTGRGRFNRKWVSNPSENLQLSILMRPTIDNLPYLSMATSLAISDTVESVTGHRGEIKWPNDVELNRKKIAGILIETDMSTTKVNFAIIGVGLNVNLDPSKHSSISSTSTSLRDITKKNMSRAVTLTIFIKHLQKYYTLIQKDISITQQWISRVTTLGKKVSLNVVGRHSEINGLAESMNEDGSLNIRLPNKELLIANAGEVTFTN